MAEQGLSRWATADDEAVCADLRARLATAETERDEAIQERHEAERLLETAWVQRDGETEKAKRAEARVAGHRGHVAGAEYCLAQAVDVADAALAGCPPPESSRAE